MNSSACSGRVDLVRQLDADAAAASCVCGAESKSDASPLNVVQQHAGEIRHFANSFRTYIQVLEPILQQCVTSGATASGILSDGVEYLALGRCDDSQTLPIQQPGATCP